MNKEKNNNRIGKEDGNLENSSKPYHQQEVTSNTTNSWLTERYKSEILNPLPSSDKIKLIYDYHADRIRQNKNHYFACGPSAKENSPRLEEELIDIEELSIKVENIEENEEIYNDEFCMNKEDLLNSLT